MYQVDKIGSVSLGVDGADEYLAVRDMEDAIDPAALEDWMLERHYVAGGGAGSYFCHSVRVLPDPIHDNRAVVIVCHRYDV